MSEIALKLDPIPTLESKRKESEFLVVPLESIPLDMPLAYPIHIKVAGQIVLFRSPGDSLALQRAQSLVQKKVSSVYIAKSNWALYVESTEKMLSAPGQNKEKGFTQIRHLLFAYGKQLEQRQVDPVLMLKMKELGFRMADGIRTDPGLGKKLLRRYRDYTLYFSNHMVNVAIYSASMGTKLNLPVTELRHLTLAALVHDMGYLFIPREIILKPSALSEEEKITMKTHSRLGAEFLANIYGIPEVTMTALQHHERMDGMGYPSGLKGNKIHLFARITTIADVYDALTNSRPYHPEPFLPQVAITMMKYMEGKFDPQIFQLATSIK